MISKQELKQILIIYEFPEEQINEIINKKIVLNQADAEMVCLNIEMLLSKGFSANRIAKCSSLLCIRKIQKIIEVYNTLNKYEVPKELIENYLYVLARGKASEIEEIFEVLYKHKISKETIENCLTVLARGKASEIEKIFEVLEKYKISKEAIEKCLSVLARGKAEEMEKVFEVLYKHKISKEAIEGCLSILAFGKASEIERIFKILYEKEISKEVIEKCLSVLARGKASEIERTFEILYKKEISKKAIERCFNVVVSGKASEIEKIFKVLENEKISKEKIEKNIYVLTKKSEELERIFNEDASLKTLELFMKLKGFYNRVMTKKELEEICNIKNISIDQILKYFFYKYNDGNLIEELNKTLDKKDAVYIGKSLKMNKEDIKKYGEQILEIAKSISKSLGYKYHYNDINELESYCVYVIINKCGGTVFNLSHSLEYMKNSIYSRTKKYCIGKILLERKNSKINFDLLENTNLTSKHNKISFNDNNLDVKKWKLNSNEEKIIKEFSSYLDSGYSKEESLKQVAEEMQMDQEELVGIMSEIKEKINISLEPER